MAVLVGVTIWSQGGGTVGFLALDVAVGVVSLALMPFLARWPTAAAVLLSVLAALSPAATPPATMAALFTGRWQRPGVAAAVAATGIAAHLIRGVWRPDRGLPFGWWVVLVCVAYAALVGWGMLLRANHALISSLRERAERAEAEQARRVAEARAMERARIAREMHDVLAHRLSLLATYAGAISYRPDAPPEQLSRAAEVIRSGAHQALEELREVITVLREDQAGEAGRPLPGYADLPRLVDESRAAGMRIEVSDGAWDPETVPPALGRTVYRVVQEGLTNARKHAPGEEVRVALSGTPGAALEVGIVNRIPARCAAPAPPGTGTGLIGLSERLALAGGRLECRPARGVPGAEFALRAWMPWPA